ncbi:MAG TPA: DUF3131 domain-containing protein [Longimicrobiales bacterium]
MTALARLARMCLAVAAVVLVVQALTAHRGYRADEIPSSFAALPVAQAADFIPPARSQLPNEDAFFADAAATAWQHFDRVLWQPKTGLAKATPHYDRITPWDMGSILAALFSAHKLGLIDDADYSARMRKTLRTLEYIPLYRAAVFHKKYSAVNARMIDRNNAVSRTGYGWSATDLGRILIWLHIVASNDAQFTDLARRVGKRVRLSETAAGGYMHGGLIGTRGKLWKFQEGRIGYEQYAAQGYAWWGADVANALDVRKHGKPIEVYGVPLLADQRGLDRLNSEPFIMAGLEFGWSRELRELALNVLAAQEARFKRTGQLTIVSEDALNVKPHYFYYYCVYCNGRSFIVDLAEPGKFLNEPRWISTKATFGWHVLVGSDYTRAVMREIAKAKTDNAWSSGVFEKSGEPTRAYDINTTAVVLEAALYRKLGRPLLFAAGN